MSEESPVETTTEVVIQGEKNIGKGPGTPGTLWTRVEQIASIASIVASVATAVGIVVLVIQIRLSNTIEDHRVAVEAIRQTRSAEFIRAFRQAKRAYQSGQIDEKEKDALIDSVNHVMNVYDDIAVIYISNIGDKCIIKDSVYSAAKEWSAISRVVSSFSLEDRKHFDLFLELMERESCDNRHLSLTN